MQTVVPLPALGRSEQVVGAVDLGHPAFIGRAPFRVEVAGQGTVGRLEDELLGVRGDLEDAVGVELVVGQARGPVRVAGVGRSGSCRS
jgi:hypothetical protein